MKVLKNSWGKVREWASRNMASIFTGWIVALIMAAIMIAKDMEHINKEIGHLADKAKLTEENHELTKVSVMQFEMINDLLRSSANQRQGLGKATETLSEQSMLIQRLVEYLKGIGHWPPKIDAPKPVDPDKWI